ncbi:MAG: ribosome assembly protein 4, partial [Cyanobacteria bacterium RU_5_0]|nr:ribosome assembly protein 4 [Cyanobacteria bacterium RU_5_0]
DNTLKLWNAADGTELRTLTGHQADVKSVSFSPDGKTIASGSQDNTLKLWNWDLDRLMAMGCYRIRPYLLTHPSDLESLPVCQPPQTPQLAADYLMREGEKLAEAGQFEAAIDQFNQAMQWQSDLAPTLSPKIAALRSQAQQAEQTTQAEARLREGRQLIKQGKIPDAIAAYTEAETLNPDVISAPLWSRLCWQGSLYGYAAEVLDACEKAVALNPSDEGIRDSRGLARALTGKAPGAIEDFRVFIQSTDNADDKSQRQRWIDALAQWLADPNQAYPFTYEALEAGEPPFQPGELDELKGQ